MKIQLMICISIATRINAKNCDTLGVLLYEDMACKAINKNKNECPTHFECDVHKKVSDSCRLRGETINVGQHADNNITRTNCNTDCICRKKDQTRNEFVCALIDCEELSDPSAGKECYWKYNAGECCPDSKICPPFNDKTVCELEGNTYRKGQRFYPNNTCYECICEKGFKGIFEKPYCVRNFCGTEITRVNEIIQNCAPVYYEEPQTNVYCCPSSWFCPSAKLKVKSNKEGNSNKSCKFGNKILKGNEKVITTIEEFGKKRTVTCTCIMPPLSICIGY